MAVIYIPRFKCHYRYTPANDHLHKTGLIHLCFRVLDSPVTLQYPVNSWQCRKFIVTAKILLGFLNTIQSTKDQFDNGCRKSSDSIPRVWTTIMLIGLSVTYIYNIYNIYIYIYTYIYTPGSLIRLTGNTRNYYGDLRWSTRRQSIRMVWMMCSRANASLRTARHSRVWLWRLLQVVCNCSNRCHSIWSINWLIGWLEVCLIGLFIHWLTDKLVVCLLDWLIISEFIKHGIYYGTQDPLTKVKRNGHNVYFTQTFGIGDHKILLRKPYDHLSQVPMVSYFSSIIAVLCVRGPHLFLFADDMNYCCGEKHLRNAEMK